MRRWGTATHARDGGDSKPGHCLSWNDTALGDMNEAQDVNEAFRLLQEAVLRSPWRARSWPTRRIRLAVRNEDRNLDGRLDPFFLCGRATRKAFCTRDAQPRRHARRAIQQALSGR